MVMRALRDENDGDKISQVRPFPEFLRLPMPRIVQNARITRVYRLEDL